MNKLVRHFKTVFNHRKEVRRLCFKCGLYWQGITHDLSKYSLVEFCNGVRFFTGTASPHIGERAQYGYSRAWVHHHNKNPHHAEYWQDINKQGLHCAIDMPDKYLLEMICDRVAASKIYLKDKFTDRAPYDYYVSHKDENQFSETTRRKLEKILLEIAGYGVDAVLNKYKNNKINLV